MAAQTAIIGVPVKYKICAEKGFASFAARLKYPLLARTEPMCPKRRENIPKRTQEHQC